MSTVSFGLSDSRPSLQFILQSYLIKHNCNQASNEYKLTLRWMPTYKYTISSKSNILTIFTVKFCFLHTLVMLRICIYFSPLPRVLFFLFHKRTLTHSLRFIYHVTSFVKPTMTTLDNLLPVEPPCITAILHGFGYWVCHVGKSLDKSVSQLSHLWNGDAKSSYLVGLLQRLYELIHVKHFSLSKCLTTISYFYMASFTHTFIHFTFTEYYMFRTWFRALTF